jgi:hypothetical protein
VRLINGSGKRKSEGADTAQCGRRREAHQLNLRQARPQRTPEHVGWPPWDDLGARLVKILTARRNPVPRVDFAYAYVSVNRH